jgi:hypothetical protein
MVWEQDARTDGESAQAEPCRHEKTHRSRRQGLAERLLGLLGYRAYRCAVCGARFLRRTRGVSVLLWLLLSGVLAALGAWLWLSYSGLLASLLE